ncbi:hypothetical protein [Methylophilus sp. Leaf414]|jgi:hypothetical protein|uniref:hypothetical protein n=1 Tax=Methylophilus sp. Leaf414 TaxID=1736371 RepID=UPI0006FA4077|nr:hypothetical protein [Methylophilus sp. Leaf414]KQT38203.1 hypothetical protein ASG24_04420 [Methylophilus sp. Leaf414]
MQNLKINTLITILAIMGMILPLIVNADSGPLLNGPALECIELDFQHVQSAPENLESIYCGYWAGLRILELNPHQPWVGGYSTHENTEAVRERRRIELLIVCNDGKNKAFHILETRFTDYQINCSKYLNFDKLTTQKYP